MKKTFEQNNKHNVRYLFSKIFREHASLVRENNPAKPDAHITERHVQCLWYDDVLRPTPLVTATGETITVTNPGRWNTEAGPDFLDAALIVNPGNRRLRGDVEVHIRPTDWKAHGHSGDTRYSNVIAHVTLFPDSGLGRAKLPSLPLHVSLAGILKNDPFFSFGSIDLGAYPYAGLNTRKAPCRDLLSQCSADDHIALLESAGRQRVCVKAERLAGFLENKSPEQILYEEIMTALGYKHNRRPFRQLAESIPVVELRELCGHKPENIYAILLGASGLIPADLPVESDEETRLFLKHLWKFWWKNASLYDGRVMKKSAWRLSGIRPANHPARRLAAAAALLASPLATLLGDGEAPETWFKKTAHLMSRQSAFSYWSHRLSFKSPKAKAPVSMIGASRISAIQSNILIPYLQASGENIEALLPFMPKENENTITRETVTLIFGRDYSPEITATGLRQQGLIQIFTDFCLNHRSDCSGCALRSALENI